MAGDLLELLNQLPNALNFALYDCLTAMLLPCYSLAGERRHDFEQHLLVYDP